MEILRVYQGPTAWYALVLLEGGERVEFKFRQSPEPTESEILAEAGAWWAAVQAADAPTVEVTAEDGTVI